MKQEVITHQHVRIFWISMAITAGIAVVIYLYAVLIPSPFDGQQSKLCEGARTNVADLQHPRDGSAPADPAKIKDAQDIVERECAKAE